MTEQPRKPNSERPVDEPLTVDLPNDEATGKPPRPPSGIPNQDERVLPGAPQRPTTGDENSGP